MSGAHEIVSMRVGYDHQIFCLQRYGGISRYFTELIPRLGCEQGIETWVWRGFAINRYPLRSSPNGIVEGVDRPAIPATNALFLKVSKWAFERRARGRAPTIYHPTYYFASSGLPQATLVITVYDMIHELFPQAHRSYREIGRRKRLLVHRADAVICISEHTKRDLMRLYGIADDKISVIPLANSLTSAPGARLLDRPYLLYVGPRSGYKNFGALLGALSQHPKGWGDHVLCCFGGGPFTRIEQVEIQRAGLRGRVHHITGDDARLASLYAHATALIYPSQYEGFGLPPLEAMHYGCPVVLSRGASLPEVAGDAALYFDPENQDELSVQLERVMGDACLRRTLSEAGKGREHRFSWTRCAAETAVLYRAL